MSSWRNHDDLDILKRLGVVDKAESEASWEDAREAPPDVLVELDSPSDQRQGPSTLLTSGTSPDDEDDDGEIVFDRDQLLSNGGPSRVGWRKERGKANGTAKHLNEASGGGLARHNRMRAGATEGRRALAGRAVLVCFAFGCVGLSGSLVGVSLADVGQRANASSLGQSSGLVSASAFGSLLGVGLGGSCFACANAFGLMGVGLGGLAAGTAAFPFAASQTALLLLAIAQGLASGFLQRAGLAQLYLYWPRKHHYLQFFYMAAALGGLLAPLVTSPIVFDSLHTVGSNQSAESVPALPTPLSLSPDLAQRNLFHRQRRRRDADEGPATPSLNGTDVRELPTATTASLSDALTPKAKKPVVAEQTKEEHPKTATEIKKEKLQKVEEVRQNASAVAASSSAGPGDGQSSTSSSAPATTTTTTTTTTLPPTTSTTTTTSTSTSTPTSTRAATTSSSTPASESQSSTAASPSGVDRVTTAVGEKWERLWGSVLLGVRGLRRLELAYALVAGLIASVGVLFLLACLCCPCHSLRLPASDEEPALPAQAGKPRRLCAGSRDSLTALLLVLLHAFLLVGLEGALTNLLSPFVLLRNGAGRSEAVTMLTLYWSGSGLGRLVMGGVRSSGSLGRGLWVCGAGSVGAASLALVVGWDWGVWAGVAGLGLLSGPLVPLSLAWAEWRLSPGWWLPSAWLAAGQCGRLLVPALTAHAMEGWGNASLLLVASVVVLVGAFLCWVAAERAGLAASQLAAVAAFSRSVKGPNGATYHQMGGGRDGEAEDVLFELDSDEDLSFRSNDASSGRSQLTDVHEDDDDIFSKYVAKAETRRL